MSEVFFEPVQIAPNLAVGVLINDHWITVEYSNKPGESGRTRYKWTVIFPDNTEVTGHDLQSGCDGGTLIQGLLSLLSFLGACGEGREYQNRTGGISENANLFPDRVAEFCEQYHSEIEVVAVDAEENNK